VLAARWPQAAILWSLATALIIRGRETASDHGVCIALGCCGMERLGQAAKAGAGGGDLLHPPRQLGRGAAQAVQPDDHQHVARVQAREQVVQLGLPAALLRGGPIFHDPLASRFGQRLPLRSDIGVVVGTDPEVADQHGAAPRDAAWFGPGLRPRGTSLASASTSGTVMDSAHVSLHNWLIAEPF